MLTTTDRRLTTVLKNTESRGFVVKLVRLAQQLALDPRSPSLNPSCEYDPADCARVPGSSPTGQTSPTPRDSISPLLKSPVLVNQRFAKDRRLTLLNFIPCGLSFNRIWLQPRYLAPTAKTQELSKNEYVFTPTIFRVKKIGGTLSLVFSIECSSSTAPCQKLVQPAIQLQH